MKTDRTEKVPLELQFIQFEMAELHPVVELQGKESRRDDERYAELKMQWDDTVNGLTR